MILRYHNNINILGELIFVNSCAYCWHPTRPLGNNGYVCLVLWVPNVWSYGILMFTQEGFEGRSSECHGILDTSWVTQEHEQYLLKLILVRHVLKSAFSACKRALCIGKEKYSLFFCCLRQTLCCWGKIVDLLLDIHAEMYYEKWNMIINELVLILHKCHRICTYALYSKCQFCQRTHCWLGSPMWPPSSTD